MPIDMNLSPRWVDLLADAGAMVIVSATATVGRQSFAGLDAGTGLLAGKGLPAYALDLLSGRNDDQGHDHLSLACYGMFGW